MNFRISGRGPGPRMLPARLRAGEKVEGTARTRAPRLEGGYRRRQDLLLQREDVRDHLDEAAGGGSDQDAAAAA
eukprot:2387847-Prymnesium_polylepis.1